jgi:hypothetical protein
MPKPSSLWACNPVPECEPAIIPMPPVDWPITPVPDVERP